LRFLRHDNNPKPTAHLNSLLAHSSSGSHIPCTHTNYGYPGEIKPTRPMGVTATWDMVIAKHPARSIHTRQFLCSFHISTSYDPHRMLHTEDFCPCATEGICVPLYVSICLRMSLCASVCLCMPVCASVCLCMPPYVCVCICMPLYVSVCFCMSLYASVCLCVPLYGSVCYGCDMDI